MYGHRHFTLATVDSCPSRRTGTGVWAFTDTVGAIPDLFAREHFACVALIARGAAADIGGDTLSSIQTASGTHSCKLQPKQGYYPD